MLLTWYGSCVYLFIALPQANGHRPKEAVNRTIEDHVDEEISHVEEVHKSRTLLFILVVTGICILTMNISKRFIKYFIIPQSIISIMIGGVIGLILKIVKITDSTEVEAFPPTFFFLIILPPIIFDSGYNLNKENFFSNFGSITAFAVIGTSISTLVIGYGIYFGGRYELIYQVSIYESFAFASLISAIDPIATLTIFEALKIDKILYMLVFGESILNDAVSIVLTTSVTKIHQSRRDESDGYIFGKIILEFLLSFIGSSSIGIISGLLSASALKWYNMRSSQVNEIGIVCIFAYLPYCLAEAINLSGIMTILFTGITMSHYTHKNLSLISQICVHEAFKTFAYLSETCMFAYLGLAIFSFEHVLDVKFVSMILFLCLIGRALNIFPLAMILNRFRSHKIPFRHQFLMWFSGLRGAIAFALCLQLDELSNAKTRKMLITTTLIVTLGSILVLGGTTKPLISLIEYFEKRKKVGMYQSMSQNASDEINVFLMKDLHNGLNAFPVDVTEEKTKEEFEQVQLVPEVKGFARIDRDYLMPLFIKTVTEQELNQERNIINELTNNHFLR